MIRGKWKTLWLGLALLMPFGTVVPTVSAVGAPPKILPQTTTTPDAPHDFNLQVTPSPIVLTVQPGAKSTQNLKIYNNGTATENLRIEPRHFSFDSSTGQVHLEDNVATDVASWVTFSQPKFTVGAGQAVNETINLNVSKDAGFSYSFALVITRQNPPKAAGGTRQITGSLAVFMLVNVNRPGATSKLQVVDFTSVRGLYEYLPATFEVRFKNTGNTIVQPTGNIFVQRSSGSKSPIATLTVNSKQGYILPDTARTFSADWNDGFATYQPTEGTDGKPKKHLNVDWSKLSHFRIGRYTARLVAVYSDGTHDVPIEGTVTFWVIPWRAIIAFILIVVALWLLARWNAKRRTAKAVKRALAAQAAAQAQMAATKHKEENAS
jgi:hypothetical protein